MAASSAPSGETTPALAGLLLAAGESRRFGAPKALHAWDGEALVVRAARLLLAACPAGVVVVTGAYGEAVAAALADLPLRILHHPGWQAGMGSSLAAGLAGLAGNPAAGVLILPCDLPRVTGADLRRLAARWGEEPARVALADFPGGPGPPAIFPRALWPALARLAGDTGGRALAGSTGDPLAVPIPGAALDVDEPGDLPGR